jgi:hypothetical protein
MKRLVEPALLGGFVGGLALFSMASCSPASSSPPVGGGNNTSTGTGGASSTTHGGGTSVGTGGTPTTGVGGGGTVQGGAGTIVNGGATSVAGSTGIAGGTVGAGGGSAGAPAMCSTDPNLVNATGCFVGCDPTLTTDNPQGLQGAFYTYGDGSSCASTTPAVGSAPPCASTGVCLSGTTVVDSTYAKWGCGIGFELNASGGTTSVKSAYSGPATCFNYTLTGSPGQNEIRVAFTQSADTTGKVSPYKSILPSAWKNGTYTGTICLGDVSCNNQLNCTPPAATPSAYDLQIGVVGGNAASGAYNICLSNLTPQGSGSSTLNPIVATPSGGQTGPSSMEAVGKYFVQTNINNDSGGSLTVTPSLNGTNAGFTINSSNLQDPGSASAPAAYPSIVDGWHYGAVSSDAALPILLSKLNTAQSSVTYTGSSGRYDASYDIWVLPTAKPANPSGGLEVMLWLNDAGVQPSGSKVGTYAGPGGNWDVWTNTQSGGWKYVAYVKLGQSSFTGDLAPFILDAANRQGIPTSQYLAGIQFGFELWQGGNFSVSSFTSTVTSK